MSWTVVVRAGSIVPVERFLAHLAATERSPNTVRACAYDLRDFFEFLDGRDLMWDRAQLDDIVRSGVGFTPHELRHTYATGLLRRGCPSRWSRSCWGMHRFSTTIDTYSHLDIEDTHRALVAAGALEAAGS